VPHDRRVEGTAPGTGIALAGQAPASATTRSSRAASAAHTSAASRAGSVPK